MYYVAYGILKDKNLAEDVIQECCLYLTKHTDIIKYPVLSNETKNFIYILTKHKALDIIRKKKREQRLLEYYLNNVSVPSVPSIENEILKTLQVEEIMCIISRLPKIYRKIMELYLIHELTPKEISDTLQIDYELTKKRLQRGRLKLKKTLKEENN